jgi:hypothetical protein
LVEVKAKSNAIYLSTSNYQILGVIDALKTHTPAALLGIANITIVTTGNMNKTAKNI